MCLSAAAQPDKDRKSGRQGMEGDGGDMERAVGSLGR